MWCEKTRIEFGHFKKSEKCKISKKSKEFVKNRNKIEKFTSSIELDPVSIAMVQKFYRIILVKQHFILDGVIFIHSIEVILAAIEQQQQKTVDKNIIWKIVQHTNKLVLLTRSYKRNWRNCWHFLGGMVRCNGMSSEIICQRWKRIQRSQYSYRMEMDHIELFVHHLMCLHNQLKRNDAPNRLLVLYDSTNSKRPATNVQYVI